MGPPLVSAAVAEEKRVNVEKALTVRMPVAYFRKPRLETWMECC